MTARSAISPIIFQILQHRPDILYKKTPSFYLRKFKVANTSFWALWPLFFELVRAVPGLFLIAICSVGGEERVFVHHFVELLESWDGPPINLVLLHPKDKSFTMASSIVDLDDRCDVLSSLEASDALHHVILHELSIHKGLSPTMVISL